MFNIQIHLVYCVCGIDKTLKLRALGYLRQCLELIQTLHSLHNSASSCSKKKQPNIDAKLKDQKCNMFECLLCAIMM